MDLDAMIVQINQEWTRLETRQMELQKELSEVQASMERLRAIKSAAEGKIVTAPRKSKEVPEGKKRPANVGAKAGQYNRYYKAAEKIGDKAAMAKYREELKKMGRWPYKKAGA